MVSMECRRIGYRASYQQGDQILRYVADGNSNKKIAQILDISEQTIKNHVSSILRKLNAKIEHTRCAGNRRAGFRSTKCSVADKIGNRREGAEKASSIFCARLLFYTCVAHQY